VLHLTSETIGRRTAYIHDITARVWLLDKYFFLVRPSLIVYICLQLPIRYTFEIDVGNPPKIITILLKRHRPDVSETSNMFLRHSEVKQQSIYQNTTYISDQLIAICNSLNVCSSCDKLL